MKTAQRGGGGQSSGPATEDFLVSGISVAIPCRSASGLMPGLLDVLRPDPVCHEVLVVVNGGARVTEEALGAKVRVLWLARAGLSAAKNLALAEASSEIVAFLDDDTIPDPGWCAALASVFVRHPGLTVAGGPIRLPQGTVGTCLGPEGRGYLGELDLGAEEVRCRRWQYPYGGNSAVRRSAARALGGFCEALGYAEGRMLPNEEIDLFRRMQAAGGEVWYVPSAAVTHRVPRSRASLRHLARRAFWQGIGDRQTARAHADLPVPRAWRSAVLAARWAFAAGFRGARGQWQTASDHALRSLRALGSVVGAFWSR